MENNEFVEKKNGKKIALLVFIILLVFLLGLFGFYFYFTKKASDPNQYLTNKANLLTGMVDDLFTNLDTYAVKENGSELKTVNHVTFKTDSKELEILNNYSFDFEFTSSLKKEEMQIYLNLKEEEKKVLDGTIFLNQDSIYLTSNDLYSKMIRLMKLEENPFLTTKLQGESYTSSELHTIFNHIIKYFFEAMKESDLKGEVFDLYKIRYTYEITEANQEKVQAKFDDLVKNDEKLQALFKEKENGTSSFAVKFSPCKIEITTNMLTNTILKISFKDTDEDLEIIKDEKEKGKGKYLIHDGKDTSYLYIKEDTITLNIFKDKKMENTIELVNKETELSLKVTDPDLQFSLSLKKVSEDTINVSFLFNEESSDEPVSIDLKGTMKKISNGYDSNLLMDVLVGEEKVSSTIKSNTIIGEDLLTKTDFSGSVAIESLSENEIASIIQNLMKKLENTKLLDLLMKDMDL